MSTPDAGIDQSLPRDVARLAPCQLCRFPHEMHMHTAHTTSDTGRSDLGAFALALALEVEFSYFAQVVSASDHASPEYACYA
jgi:hypothetical protein